MDGCSGNAHGDRSRGPLFCAGLCKRSRYHAVAAEDFFYWVFAWIFVFLMFRDRNYGQIRGYVLAALILGMLFYILLFSRRILLVFSTFFGFLSRMIAGLFRLILMPAGKSVKKLRKMVRKALKKKIKQVRMVIVKK